MHLYKFQFKTPCRRWDGCFCGSNSVVNKNMTKCWRAHSHSARDGRSQDRGINLSDQGKTPRKTCLVIRVGRISSGINTADVARCSAGVEKGVAKIQYIVSVHTALDQGRLCSLVSSFTPSGINRRRATLILILPRSKTCDDRCVKRFQP